MIESAWFIFLKSLGPKFSSYLLPKFKNKKFVRDIKDRWVKDNYTQKTTLMFRAAFDDAKTVLDLPDELAIALLEDQINRSEVFRWILEGTSSHINWNLLNLDPYYESYQEYQDLIRPFFEFIASSLNDYKTKNWEPEFLELLHKVGALEEVIEESFSTVIDKQTLAIDLAEENNRYLKEVITPTEFNDLNELMKKGLLKSSREKAIERLNKPNIKSNETLELHIVIANTYIENKEFENAIPHLYTAITHCKDEARKERLLSLINILEERFERAEYHVKQAIKTVGETPENINVLLNVLISQSRFKEAIDITEKWPVKEYEEILSKIWISLEEFNKVIDLTNEKLKNDQLNITWLLLKAEAIVLKAEKDISNNKIIYPELTLQEVLPLLEIIENHTTERTYILDRVKELKACLYYRTNRFSEARVLYEELFQKRRNFNSLTFNNLLLNVISSKEWKKSVSLLEEKKANHEIDLEEMLILADSYINTGTAEKAVQILKENYLPLESFETAFSYYSKYIDGLYAQLKHTEIIDLINSLPPEESNSSMKNILNGYYSYKKQDWDNTISLFEPNLDKFNDQDLVSIKLILIVAYFNKQTQSNYNKLKETIVTIPNWIQHESLVNQYIKALYYLKEYRTIIDLEEKLPFCTVEVLEIITTIYFNYGWYEKAKENYLSLYQQTSELKYQLRYANCFYQLGNINSCLEVLSAAEIEVNKHENIEDYKLLSIAYKEAMEYRKSIEYAYKTFSAGKSYAQIWGFYFYHFSILSKFIEEPEECWLKEYQNVMENFEITFPNEDPIFKKITILENNDLSPELISNLKLPNESFEEAISLFIKHNFPINFLVNVLNKGPFETWAFVVNNKELPIGIINGSSEELVSGLKMALSTKEILCDFTTLLMLSHLKLLEALKSEFKLYIQQEQFNAALQEYYNNKVSIHDGIKTMAYNNEKIQMTEYTPEQVRETVENQELLLNWIKENCILVGNIIKNQDSKPEETLYIDSIFDICKNQSLSLLIDSVTIRVLAKDMHNINCISTFDIINLLSTKKMCTQQERSFLIGKLLMANYTLIPITYLYEICLHINPKTSFSLDLTTISNNYLQLHMHIKNININQELQEQIKQV